MTVPTTLTCLDQRRKQLLFASRAKFHQELVVTKPQWFKLRDRIMESYPEFSVSDVRENNEYMLKRGGRSGSEEEYLLTVKPEGVKPEGIAVAVGKNVSVEVFAELYHAVWSAVLDVIEIPRSALSEFDIRLVWAVTTRGNPYNSTIIPGLGGSALQALEGLFVYEFDPRIRFQTECDRLQPMWYLSVESPYGFDRIARLATTNEDNEVVVTLGIGLTADFIGASADSFLEITGKHWRYVADALGNRVYPEVIEPVLRALERGGPVADAKISRRSSRKTTKRATKKSPKKAKKTRRK